MQAVAELVTQAEFARMRGVSRVAVNKWLASGRIRAVERDGKRLIDPVAAATSLKGTEQRADEVRDLLDGQDEQAAQKLPSLTDLKADTERERSTLLRLERLQREGRLVDREQVEREQAAAALIVKRALDTLPSKADDLVSIALKDGSIGMRKALRSLVRDLQESLARALTDAADATEEDEGLNAAD